MLKFEELFTLYGKCHDIFIYKKRFGTSPERHCLTAMPYRLFQGNLNPKDLKRHKIATQKERNYPSSIMRGKEFASSKKILEGRARCLRQQRKISEPCSELDSIRGIRFMGKQELGDSSPRSLIQTVWWYNCLNFGMRGRQEQYDLKLEHFKIEKDSCERTCVLHIRSNENTQCWVKL